MKKYESLIDIVLDMGNGIYQFNQWSGTGKTYLFKRLRALQKLGYPIVAYTYSDYTDGASLKELIDEKRPEVIMLDRQDLYYDDKGIVDAIKEYENRAIILVCNKQGHIPGIKLRVAKIEYNREEIKVTGW